MENTKPINGEENIHFCEYCGEEVTPEDNYAGYFEEYCCKRCADAADSIN